MDGVGKAAGFVEVGLAGLAPDHVGVRCVGKAARDGRVQSARNTVKAFAGASLAGEEGLILGIDVAGDELGAVGVGTGDEDGGHAADIGGKARGDQLMHGFLSGDEDFAAHVSALFGGAELVLEVNGGSAGFDHSLHQLEGVEGSTESGFGVGHERERASACRSCPPDARSGRRAAERY